MHPATSQWRFQKWLCLALSPVPVLIMLAVSYAWHLRLPPGGSAVYTGMLQGDQPTYTALAHAIFTRGNGITYANPFEYHMDVPYVLFNVSYFILGWMMRLSGGHDVLAWELWRVGWGTLGSVLWFFLVRHFIHGTAMRWWAFLAGALGGGAAWIIGLAHAAAGEGSWLAATIKVEGDYGWWCLNFFRQSLYPLEVYNHALLLAALLCYATRRRAVLLVIAAMLWSSHPITAILTTSIIGGALFFDILSLPDRPTRKANIVTLFILALISLAAVYYYRIFLPRFPSIADWIRQTLAFTPHLGLRRYPLAYSLLPFIAILLALLKRTRHWLLHERTGRLTLLWCLCVFIWANNDVFLFKPIQPMHFMRGHLYLGMVMLISKGFDLYRCEIRAHLAWSRRRARAIALASLLLLLPDNVLFVARVATQTPNTGLLVLSPRVHDVLNFYKTHPDPQHTRVTFSMDQWLGLWLIAQGERVYISEAVLTPYFEIRAAKAYKPVHEGDNVALRKLGITHIILPILSDDRGWIGDPQKATTLFDAGIYRVSELR